AAANVMARDPAALQLRLLQTVVEVASEKNSTLVMPVPVELLRFFDRGSGQPAQVSEVVEDTGDAEVAAAEAAIENKPVPPEAAAIGQDETLAIPPVAKVPASPVADASVPEPVIPDPVIPDPEIPEQPRIPEARNPQPRVPGAPGAAPSSNGAGDQSE